MALVLSIMRFILTCLKFLSIFFISTMASVEIVGFIQLVPEYAYESINTHGTIKGLFFLF